MYEDVSVVKELANLKIHDILDDLGIDYRDRYHSLTAPCPVHCSSRIDSWSWHVDRGIWSCFSRSCHVKYNSDIFGLVKALRSCSFSESIQYLKKFVDLSISKADLKKIVDARQNKEFVIKTRKDNRKAQVFPETALGLLQYHGYLESRGFSRKIVEEYHAGVGESTGRYMSNRVVFPIRNMRGEIIGFTGRTLLDDWKQRGHPKWLHSRDYDAKNNLFNIDRAAPYIRETETAIIVEGPLDVLRLEDAGVRNSVAVLGKTLFNEQMTILMNVPAFKLVLALDNDTAGKHGMAAAHKTVQGFFDVELLSLPKSKNDIGDLTTEEIREIFNDNND